MHYNVLMMKVALGPFKEHAEEGLDEIRYDHNKAKETFAIEIEKAGWEVGELSESEHLIWCSPFYMDELEELLDVNPQIKWVQLFYAGVDSLFDTSLVNRSVKFSKVHEVYADEVAQHILALIFGLYFNLKEHSIRPHWHPTNSRYLTDKTITIIGAGGNAKCLVPYLKPFDVKINIARRSDVEFLGADKTILVEDIAEVLSETDILVYLAPLTSETKDLVDYEMLSSLKEGAIFINVGRGKCVVQADLIRALEEKKIAGAGLDVTEPEPLPEDNKLWTFENVIITSHSANSQETTLVNLAKLVYVNLTNIAKGEEPLGVVDFNREY